jgi:7,8-dihydropterin-6-yl-methyl-4-(beta-D-ribofuranosyl)aminobenzene 5'-phosphate synthase
MLGADRVERFCDLRLSAEPVWLTDRLVFLGEVPRVNDFENQSPVGKVLGENGYEDCFVAEDSALAYVAEQGLVVITGCSHAGVCNIIEHARMVTGVSQVLAVIGGLHLLDPGSRQLRGTVNYIKGLNLERLYACHCTDLASKVALAQAAPPGEAGVGLRLDYR